MHEILAAALVIIVTLLLIATCEIGVAICGLGVLGMCAMHDMSGPVWVGEGEIDLRELGERLAKGAAEPCRSEYIADFVKYYGDALRGRLLKPRDYVDELEGRITYQPSAHFPKFNTHWGQAKLFLSEIFHFLNYLGEDERAVIFYAGAAPSNHTGFLARLFTNIRFVLIDPNPFNIFGHESRVIYAREQDAMPLSREMCATYIRAALDSEYQITIIRDYFTLDLARGILEVVEDRGDYDRVKYGFVSDIRTSFVRDYIGEDIEPDEFDITFNNALQSLGYIIMGKVISNALFKFRYPFYGHGTELLEKYRDQPPFKEIYDMSAELGHDLIRGVRDKCVIAPRGRPTLQMFAGDSSTETRLEIIADRAEGDIRGRRCMVPVPVPLIRYGDAKGYDSRLFWFNNILRWMPHYNEYAIQEKDIRDGNRLRAGVAGFDLCHECARVATIFRRYQLAYTGNDYSRANVLDLVKEMTRACGTRPGGLRYGNHGYLFEPLPVELLSEYANRRQKYEGRPSLNINTMQPFREHHGRFDPYKHTKQET